MKTMLRLRPLVLCSAALLWLAAGPGQARAAFLFMLTQTNGNVVVTGSGTLNTTALTLVNSNYTGAGSTLLPTGTVLAVDPANVNVEQFSGFSGPTTWGSGGPTTPGTASGNAVVVSGQAGYLFVPLNYASGATLSDTMTFTGATFATLGFTSGKYTYTWGTGANADSLTVTSAVPEPSTWALLAVGVTGLCALTLRRRPGMA